MYKFYGIFLETGGEQALFSVLSSDRQNAGETHPLSRHTIAENAIECLSLVGFDSSGAPIEATAGTIERGSSLERVEPMDHAPGAGIRSDVR